MFLAPLEKRRSLGDDLAMGMCLGELCNVEKLHIVHNSRGGSI